MNAWGQAGICVVVGALCALWRRSLRQRGTSGGKKQRFAWVPTLLLAVSVWYATGQVMRALFGVPQEELHVEIFAPKTMFFGMSISSTIVSVWAIMAVVLVLAVLFRLLVVPRLKDRPRGLQNIIEICIESIDKYTKGQVHGDTGVLASYFFAVAVLLIGSAFTELLGVRPPSADLVMTLSLALCTFFLINYYAIKRKGVSGRLKSMAEPTPVILPIKILTDIAVPVSLACRLFGNMLGGLIVMDMLKIALGSSAIGIPPIAGLYFNVFHPLIQVYIFVTLSLTFINEAVE